MKSFISFLILMIHLMGCKTTKPVAEDAAIDIASDPASSVNFSEQTTWLLGYFDKNMMKREPHSEWYFKEHDDYVPEAEALNKLLNYPADDLSIKIIMGTWCSDSRREVPRFMKILEACRFPEDNVLFIGVDDAKLSPVGEYEILNIQRVPTFIIYKNNIEAGRIIEVPVTSLEQDMVNILTRNE